MRDALFYIFFAAIILIACALSMIRVVFVL